MPSSSRAEPPVAPGEDTERFMRSRHASPQRRSFGKRLMAVLLVPLVLFGMYVWVTAAGLVVFGLWLGSRDDIRYIEGPVIEDTAMRACEHMHRELAELTDHSVVGAGDGASGPSQRSDAAAAEQVALMRRQDDAVRRMVADVRDLGEPRLAQDLPTQLWLEDWERLVRDRGRYADDLIAGDSPRWVVRTSAGSLVADQMEDVLPACEVPIVLVYSPVPPN
jgi:hypothetical protein